MKLSIDNIEWCYVKKTLFASCFQIFVYYSFILMVSCRRPKNHPKQRLPKVRGSLVIKKQWSLSNKCLLNKLSCKWLLSDVLNWNFAFNFSHVRTCTRWRLERLHFSSFMTLLLGWYLYWIPDRYHSLKYFEKISRPTWTTLTVLHFSTMQTD